ncbi:MAG: YeiH family protein, partial [Polyangiales bacterium]
MRLPQWLPQRTDLRGIALALFVGGLALGITRALPPSPILSDILIALVLGTLVLNTPLRSLLRLELPAADREPDKYAPGLRFTGKWVLRLGIILMGLKVQTSFFHAVELLLIGGVAFVALPSTFFVAHALSTAMGVRRPMGDLVAGGTMICGASAVNAIAPVAKAHREEQGVAIAVIFLFSIVALMVFRPIAQAIGLDSSFAGLWSGLAVNDLSSAIAVGSQMGGTGGVMATTAKSARILLLAPTLVTLSFMRRESGPISVKKSIVDALPRFLLGY